ncbi:Stearoyl-[acyl-carrier-protein] 9-desaturase 7, chloroplastic, partial [Asimina triloba]
MGEKLSSGLSGAGRQAQGYVCRLPARIRRLEERALGRANEAPIMPSSWIFNRHVTSRTDSPGLDPSAGLFLFQTIES